MVLKTFGPLIGSSLWVTLTEQRVSAGLLLLCWCVLAVAASNILVIGLFILLLQTNLLSVGRDGSGGAGLFMLLLLAVAAGTVIAIIVGLTVGSAKAQARKRG